MTRVLGEDYYGVITQPRSSVRQRTCQSGHLRLFLLFRFSVYRFSHRKKPSSLRNESTYAISTVGQIIVSTIQQ